MNYINSILVQIFDYIHNFIKGIPAFANDNYSYGLAIILFTIIVKTIVLPLYVKQIKSSAKMQEMQPHLQEVQKKYKGDPTKLQEETMKLYKEYGANPVSGCLPLLLTMPIFIAMYNLVNNIEISGISFTPLIPDLGATKNIILSVLAGVTTYISSKLIMAKGDNPQAKMMSTTNNVMAIMFIFITFSAKSALGLYWLISNIYQILQTLAMKKLGIIGGESVKSSSIESSKDIAKEVSTDTISSKGKKKKA